MAPDPSGSVRPVPDRPEEDPLRGCPLPDDRLYDLDNDVWVLRENSPRVVRLGITAPLLALTGRIQAVRFRRSQGMALARQSVGTVESLRYVGPVRTPRAGEILAVHEELRENPRLINEDPYGEGWLARLLLTEEARPSADLVEAATARRLYEPKIRSWNVRCRNVWPDADLYEIGRECSAILVALDEEMERHPKGDVIHLVTDDATAPIEMVRWLSQSGHTLVGQEREGTLFHFYIRKTGPGRVR